MFSFGSEFNFEDYRELIGNADELLATAAFNRASNTQPRSIIIWVENDLPFSRFQDLVERIRDNIESKFANGIYRLPANNLQPNPINRLAASMIGFFEEQRFVLDEKEGRINLKAFTSMDFLRLDTGVFSISYEGRKKVIQIFYDAGDEVAGFLENMLDVEITASLKSGIRNLTAGNSLPKLQT